MQPLWGVTGPGSHRWLWRCFVILLSLSSVKLMVCDGIVPSIQDLAFKDCAEGLASKPESYREPKKVVNTIADGLYQLDSIVFGQHPKLQTFELEV